jgi:hypothetical protein
MERAVKINIAAPRSTEFFLYNHDQNQKAVKKLNFCRLEILNPAFFVSVRATGDCVDMYRLQSLNYFNFIF